MCYREKKITPSACAGDQITAVKLFCDNTLPLVFYRLNIHKHTHTGHTISYGKLLLLLLSLLLLLFYFSVE